jgi:hypothetical protein
MGSGSILIKRLEVPNPRGLDNKELFLDNEDLKPVEAGRRGTQLSVNNAAVQRY